MEYSRLSLLLCGATLFYLIYLTEVTAISGLYVDNGVDQTVLQRTLTRRERQNVEKDILELLGLPERPVRPRIPERKGRKSRTRAAALMARHRHPHLTKSAPQFLLDVYQALSDSPSAGSALHDFNITRSDQTAIDESDVIMTFASHSDHVSGLRHERGKRLWFDVTEVAAGQGIVGAELRLYQTGFTDDMSVQDIEYTIAVYMVGGGEKEIELVATLNTTRSYQGWLTLNVTKPLKTWVAFPSSNEGLYLSVHQVKRPGHELRVEDVGIVSSNGDEERQPFMAAFLKAGGKVRTPRETPRNRNKKSEVAPVEYQRNPFTESTSRWWPKTCQIQNLYVSFKDLEWQDWIIAPDGYGAFYCSGECNFPLNAHMNATNHAIVQTLVHLMNPTEVPKPCCAPTKLTPISVLYFLDDYNVILKKYKNMVVKSCGCQ